MRATTCSSILVLSLAAPQLVLTAAPDKTPAHAENDLYQSLLKDGLTIAGAHVAFPAPLLQDGDTPEAERKALRTLAGSDQAVKDLLRDSQTAPHILKVRDVKAGDGTIIRVADLWFVIRAKIDEIDPAQFGGKQEEEKPVEAGGMRFVNHLLGDDELKERGIQRSDPKLEWFSHMTGDLLDRIHVESTDRVRATRSEGSWVFASRTDPRFDDDPKFPNRWWPFAGSSNPKPTKPPQRYPGGASTTRISRLAAEPGALLVEGHIAFTEPRPWFDGAPILRSKISLVAQDQIRHLRRELARKQQETKPKP